MDTQATRDGPVTPVLQAMDTQATRDIPPFPDPGAMGTQATRHSPLTPVPRPMDRLVIRDTPHPRPMDTRADRHTLPIPVSVMGIPWLAIPAIALRRTGRLEPSTASSLLAELRAQNLP